MNRGFLLLFFQYKCVLNISWGILIYPEILFVVYLKLKLASCTDISYTGNTLIGFLCSSWGPDRGAVASWALEWGHLGG